MDDLEAIRRLKRGDIGGLEILVSCCQRKAIYVAILIVGVGGYRFGVHHFSDPHGDQNRGA
jgi:hypothetical protein